MDFVKRYGKVIVLTFVLCMLIKPALCFLIIGTLGAYIGLDAVIFLKKITKTGIDWTGSIIEYQSDSDGHKTPTIEFKTITGDIVKEQPFIYTSTDLSKIRSFRKSIGQSVSILYDPDDPKKFILKNEALVNYIGSVFSILLGLLFVGLGVSWLLGYIKMD